MSDVFESTISQNEYENKISDLSWKIHLLENKLEEAENQIKEKIKLLREIKTTGSHYQIKEKINKYMEEK